MTFDIRISGEDEDGDPVGRIEIGDFREPFAMSEASVSRRWYQAQWRRAVRAAVVERRLTAIISSLDIEGYGVLWLRPLVPAELVTPVGHEPWCRTTPPDPGAGGVFLTERIMFVTTDPTDIDPPETETNIDMPVRRIDPADPEALFRFLDTDISDGVSYWHCGDEALLDFLRRSDLP